MSTTRDIAVGDRIDIPDFRGVIVTGIEADGVWVMWFTPDGVGPHHACLPHGALNKTRYHDERNGEGKSWWDTHPDITGKYDG